MVLANEAVSRMFSKYPFLYRVHELPDEEDVEKAAKIILKQFRKFGLTMHVGDKTDPKLRQCTSLPPSKKLVNQEKKTKKTNNINLPNGKNLHFTWHLKYLGSFISPELNEDAEITYRIKS